MSFNAFHTPPASSSTWSYTAISCLLLFFFEGVSSLFCVPHMLLDGRSSPWSLVSISSITPLKADCLSFSGLDCQLFLSKDQGFCPPPSFMLGSCLTWFVQVLCMCHKRWGCICATALMNIENTLSLYSPLALPVVPPPLLQWALIITWPLK